jgi:hypothetical protein
VVVIVSAMENLVGRRRLLYIAPAAGSKFKRGTAAQVRVALVSVIGARIADARATSLVATPCKVKFSATGSQNIDSVCMTYNATTNEFCFNSNLGTTRTGSTSLKVAATYNYSMPESLTTTKSRGISVI